MMVLGLRIAHGQSPGADYGRGAAMPTTNASVPLTSTDKGPPGLSQYIIGTDPDCCGELSDHTPLKTELFLRSGISLKAGDGQMRDSLTDVGWAIEGGFRALCFNARGDAAWAADMHLLNINYSSTSSEPQVLLLNLKQVGITGPTVLPAVLATVQSYNRTFVGMGFGRDWYLFGSASGTRTNDGALWHIGIDGGGRWGTAKATFHEIRHLTDTIGGMYLGVHSDLDIPCGCCTFFAGIRGEWAYTWADILQIQNKSDLQDFNLLLNFGVRY
jgi:hypothetical protein